MDFEENITDKLIELALEEDRVIEDITTNSLKEYDNIVIAEVIAKEPGIISGIDIFCKVFDKVDPDIKIEILKNNGDSVDVKDRVLKITGYESSILRAERTGLNFLQRLSGSASLTAKYIKALDGHSIKLLDTRKTTPGMRYLEKKAVIDGGGRNHRMNLEDMAMIKDNHILMAGTISNAVNKIRENYPDKKIEVEVKNIVEFKEAVALNVDIIMLDNFTEDKLTEVLRTDRGEIKIEISGNVTLENIKEKIKNGVDYISVGALTHSYKALDLSLNIIRG